MAHAVEAVGASQAAARLHTVGERASKQRDTFEREGRYAQRHITGVPVATGRLSRGTTGSSDESVLTVTDRGYTIATKVPYARYVFKGTQYMPARPPKVPPDAGRRAAHSIGADLERA